MKRKFISALMFGALIVASSGTFVSCSDNDDDIASLNDQASSLKSQLEKQVTALDEAKAALEKEIKSAKESAASAIAKAEAAQQAASSAAESAKAEAIAQANTYAQQAAEEAAKAAAAEAKKQAVEEATAAAQALINSIEPGLTAEQVDAAIADKLTDVIARIKAIEDADYLTLSDLSDYLKKSDLDLTSYATKEALQTAINELKNQYVAVETYNNFLKGDFKNLSDLVSSIQQDVNSLKGTFTGAAAEKWNKTSEQLSALLNGFEGTTLQEALTSITNRVKALEDAAAKGEFTEAEKASIQELIDASLTDIKTLITGINDDLLVLITQELRGLVFQPDFYYGGIEALDAATFHYNELTLVNAEVNANDDFRNDGIKTTAEKETSMVPDLEATYHLNPSNAIISLTDMSKYTFKVLNSQYVSKSEASDLVPIAVSASRGEGNEFGMLTVKARYSNAELIKKEDMVTVMALQYHVNDSTTITSDYAAIRAVDYTKLVIARVAEASDEKALHLPTSAAAAIASTDVAEIVYNNTSDLDSLVQSHYTTEGNCIEWDEMAANHKVEKKGFKYEYALIGYNAPDGTAQTAHLALAADGHTVRPQSVDNNGKQQAYGTGSYNRANIGREPLVRVILRDTIHNKIAAVGYLKLRIVEKTAAAKEYEKTTPYTANQEYNLGCADNEVTVINIAWPQVENKIMSERNLKKEEFSAYDIVTLSGDTQEATQYVSNAVDAKTMTQSAFGRQFGKIYYTEQEGNTTTGSLKWVVTNQDVYDYFKPYKKGGQEVQETSITVYIRFTNGSTTFCVPFTWTPSAINITPSIALTSADKIDARWYAANSKNAGFDEIHAHVGIPFQNGKTSSVGNYVYDLTGAFVTNFLQNKLASNYKNLTVTPAFTFIEPTIHENVPGYTTAQYSLSVNNDGSQLLAAMTKNAAGKAVTNDTPQVVATITTAGTITYSNTDYAKDLLNYADHSALGNYETLTGRVSIAAVACDPAQVTMSGNVFDVKFLRPISIASGNAGSVSDGKIGGDKAQVSLVFTDFLGNKFASTSQNLFSYYGVKSIEQDGDITTTLNGGTLGSTSLAGLTNNYDIKYVAPSGDIAAQMKNNNFGTVYYNNTGATTRGVSFRIPLKVTYDWGTISTYFDITVSSTVSNSRHR